MFYLVSISDRSGSNSAPHRKVIGEFESAEKALATFGEEGGGPYSVFNFFTRESEVSPYVIDDAGQIWDMVPDLEGPRSPCWCGCGRQLPTSVAKPVCLAEPHEVPDMWR